ncbi:McrC family protein [Mycoplasmopsis cynos]|uniref:McrC family protein n=1 Tax=Mycoplasmopsis cynos TaxID=171284 RepID=UPI0025409CE6|nr:McrC family protein [Mycoplasmopsis cynos]MCU9935064.1 McrC family protein [Mycoplasmopsis cynos]
MKNKITFYGRDFSDIYKDIDRTQISGSDFELLNSNKKNILLYFLNKIKTDVEELVVNKSKKRLKYELFNQLSENKHYFDGLVGILSKSIKIKKSDIKGELSKQESNDEYEIEITLQIQSRFDVIKKDGDIGEPNFLSTMLSDKDLILNEDFIPLNSKVNIFDYLLLFSYKYKLKEASIKGLFRTYQRFEKNDDKLRGTIDVSKHIKQNMWMNSGLISYSYRENTIDNYTNHLIVKTYQYLKKKYFSKVNRIFDSDAEMKRLIDNLSFNTEHWKYSLKTTIMKNLNSISHPFYIEYESLRKICLNILRNEGISVFNGDNSNKVEGILFYIPTLWEIYLEEFLKSDEYTLSSQKEIKIIDYEGKRKFKQSTFPDYVFSSNDNEKKPFIILDAKFKEVQWSKIIFKEESFSDVLSDYDKCIRDMVSINCHASGVIFPSNHEKLLNPEPYVEHSISEFNNVDKFYTFPVFIPFSSNDYKSWKKDFINNLNKTSSLVKSYIIKEKKYIQNTEIISKQAEELRK